MYKKEYQKQYLTRLKLRVMEKLGGAKCQNCGCDNIWILEINHKYGDGNIERNKRNSRSTTYLFVGIIYGYIPTERYNVLCKVCNIQHYIETVLDINGHKVIWQHGSDCANSKL